MTQPQPTGRRYSVLVVEDEVAIAEPLLYVLKNDGFDIRHVLLGRDALATVTTSIPDILVLDIGLPDTTGFDVLRQIRAEPGTRALPVLFLTARSEELDRVLGLELGADDYVVKPFSPREVAARIRAILRRGKTEATPSTSAAWSRNPEALRIAYHGVVLDLTRNEYRLLDLLLSQPSRVFLRDEIMDRVWFDSPESSDRTIDAHVKTVRAKMRVINPDADSIRTHRGMGYSLELE